VTHRHVQALAAAGFAGAIVALALPLSALGGDDDKAPGPPEKVHVSPGEGWTTHPHFKVSWSNPEHRSRIVTAHYQLCRVEPDGECEQRRVQANDIHELELTVPQAGDYTLVAWLDDSRGRSDPKHGSAAVHLRFDDQPPTSRGLELGSGADRASLSLSFEDPLSGPGEAEIQLRPKTGAWRSLATTVEPAGHATARIADLKLPDGTYEARALVKDLTGNMTVIDHGTDGEALEVVLPMRSRNAVSAFGHVTRTARRCRTVTARVRGRIRRRLACSTVTERQTIPFPGAAPIRLAHADRIVLSGSLQGVSAGSRALEVVERPRTPGAAPRTTPVEPDGSGRFQLVLEPGPSRTIEIRYAGDQQNLAAKVQAAVLVPAAGTLTVDRRLVRNGDTVQFSGRLLGAPIPEQGRTVDLQAFYRGAWRTFATPRTDEDGGWRHPYRFGATRGRVAYRFRVLIQREAGYPYEAGMSRPVTVIVRGA
jgi:hypothetical protein